MYAQKHPIDSVLVIWLWRQLKIGYLMLISWYVHERDKAALSDY